MTPAEHDALIPPPLVALIERRRAETAAALRAQAAEIEAMPWPTFAHHHGATFAPTDEGYRRALTVATGYDGRGRQDGLRDGPGRGRDGETITLRRYPSKQSWAWRVETGSCEWYVTAEVVAAAWRTESADDTGASE